jgi:hypothetical protein
VLGRDIGKTPLETTTAADTGASAAASYTQAGF